MGQNPEQAFGFSCFVRAQAQRRSQAAPGLRKHAFHVPATAVHATMETLFHLAAGTDALPGQANRKTVAVHITAAIAAA